jgi:hypothetical protein
LYEESVIRVTFADKLKDENYFMAKSRIRVRLKPADAE